jgi:predicted nuclease with TOPRIM domain
MREQLEARLTALRRELETGRARLQELEREQVYVHETLLRISGAVQVLEELLAEASPMSRNGAGPDQPAAAARQDTAAQL